MRARCLALAALASLAVAAASPVAAQRSWPGTTDPRFDAVRDTIRRLMERRRLPSVAVAVAERGRIVWEQAFGFADLERRVPATPETSYSLASISKPFTATGVLTLVQAGKIDLDRPANDYLGAGKLHAFEGSADSATVRRLLGHSTGLPLHYQFFYAGGPPRPPMDTTIARWGILVAPPGEHYYYSNLGFGILGYIATRVSGDSSYADFMRRAVFEPLGLRHTFVSDGAGLGDAAAIRYDDENRPIAPYLFDHDAASAVWSSADDLIRFGLFNLGHRQRDQRQILSPALLRLMHTGQTPTGEPGGSYAMGWGTRQDEGGYRSLAHTGGMPGVSTQLRLYPDADVAIVVLVNKSADGADLRIARAIAATVLPKWRPNPPRRDTATGLPGVFAGKWVGRLRLPSGDTVGLRLDVRSDGDVHVQLAGRLPTVLADASVGPDGWLGGVFAGDLPGGEATPPGAIRTENVYLGLHPRGDRLAGFAAAETWGDRNRLFGAVSYFVELARERPH